MSLTKHVKAKLTPFPGILRFASLAWMGRRPSTLIRHLRAEKFRNDCYRRFQSGERRVHKELGGYQCAYEAISSKNYWHLSVGSQHEDSFIDSLFKDYLKPGMVVLDVGGHVGMWAVPLAKHVGSKGKVYVFEPEAKGYEATLRNIEINHLDNVVVMRLALSDSRCTEAFYIRPDKDTHSLFQETLAPSPTGTQEVHQIDVATVDDLVERNVISAPNFVKIDVEGAELKVLDGMKRSATRIAGVLVEIHAEELILNGVQNPHAAVEESVASLGFPNRHYLDPIHLLATR